MQQSGNFWTGDPSTAGEGDFYRFWSWVKADRATNAIPHRPREFASDQPFPIQLIVRSDTSYPWHDAAYVTPDYSNMIVYQIHIGTFNVTNPGVSSTFLDVVEKIPNPESLLASTCCSPSPSPRQRRTPALGYDGADSLLPPDFPYVTTDAAALAARLVTINNLLGAKGQLPVLAADISSGPNQLRALEDLCHLYGIGVVFDVVESHAGGFEGDDLNLEFPGPLHLQR